MEYNNDKKEVKKFLLMFREAVKLFNFICLLNLYKQHPKKLPTLIDIYISYPNMSEMLIPPFSNWPN